MTWRLAPLGLAGAVVLALASRVPIPMVRVPVPMQALAILVIGAVAGGTVWRGHRGGPTGRGRGRAAASGARQMGVDAFTGAAAGYLSAFPVAAWLARRAPCR